MSMARPISFAIIAICTMLATGCVTGKRNPLGVFDNTAKVEPNFAQEISLARLSERQGNTQGARKLYRHILEQSPNHQLALHRMGVLSGKEGDYDGAVEFLNRAKQSGSPSAELLSDLGYVQYLRHEIDLAQVSLKEALQIDPDHKEARTNLGLVLAEQGNYGEALAQFRRSCSEAEALSNLAYIQVQRGDVQLAEANYSKSLDLNKRLRPAGEALAQIGQLERSLAHEAERYPRSVPADSPSMEMTAQRTQSSSRTGDSSPAIEQPATDIEPAKQLASAAPESHTIPSYPTTRQNPLRLESPALPASRAVASSQLPSGTKEGGTTPTPVATVGYSGDKKTVPSPEKSVPSTDGLSFPKPDFGTATAIYHITDQPQVNIPRTSISQVQSASASAAREQVNAAIKAAASK